MSLNKEQQRIADTTEGLLMVDAGPGTGKTHTISQRYVNLIKSGISPSEILMVTFTNNSAREMSERIRNVIITEADSLRKELKNSKDKITKEEYVSKQRQANLLNDAKDQVRSSTFDSLCYRIVLSSPDIVSEFFGIKEVLSRGANLEQNGTVNYNHFQSFYAQFRENHPNICKRDGYDIPALLAENVKDLFNLINRLMSYGIIPLDDDEWFGDGRKRLVGKSNEIKSAFSECVNLGFIESEKKYSPTYPDDIVLGDPSKDKPQMLSPETIGMIADENREQLIDYIRYVYFEYIRQSIRENRLTFSLVKIFSFVVLYQSKFAREQNAVEYMMVDEFQDTDEIQMMICLMLLKKDNLCVVGDWKQGIYGFRNATVDNILRFREKIENITDMLGNRVQFDYDPDRYSEEKLVVNYRSTKKIIDAAFDAMYVRGTKEEKEPQYEEGQITSLESFIESDENEGCELYREFTDYDCFRSEEENEYSDIVDKITEYIYGGKAKIVEDGKARNPNFGDICVLFRNKSSCNEFFEEAKKRNISVFLQVDADIMSSVAGKLALAWMRFVNDKKDKRGLIAILAHMGFSMSDIDHYAKDDFVFENLPNSIKDEWRYLKRKSRRPIEMLTSIFAFHRLDEYEGMEDEMQAIINVVSSAYSESLMTLPRIIRLIEDDINHSNGYGIDPVLGRNAVTVQSVHKSKGLEFPIVIVAGINRSTFPSTKSDNSLLIFDELFGLRCKKEFLRTDSGLCGILDSWRFRVIHNYRKRNYDEERRLLFVALSRAKQYLTVCAKKDGSQFYKDLTDGMEEKKPVPCEVSIQEMEKQETECPEIPEYARRRRNLAVHDLMTFIPGDDGKGKGKEYGTMVHNIAQQMALGRKYDQSIPETEYIAKILDSVSGSEIRAEVDCALPMGDVTLRGIIDLMAVFDDRIEVHDYKTDEDDRNFESYVLQLSVYALAVSKYMNKPVRCFVDYVSQKVSREVTVIPEDQILRRVEDTLAHQMDIDQIE